MKEHFDKLFQFKVGDLVYIKTDGLGVRVQAYTDKLVPPHPPGPRAIIQRMAEECSGAGVQIRYALRGWHRGTATTLQMMEHELALWVPQVEKP